MSDTTKSVDDELYQKITDICLENGGVTKPMVDRLYALFTKQLQEAEIRARVDEAYIADRTVGMYPDYAKMKQATLQRIDDIRKGLFISLTLTQDTKGGNHE